MMNKTYSLTRGGIYTALSFLCVYLSTVLPTNKIYALGIACCIIPFSILTIKMKYSIIVYTATCLLSLLLLGIKGSVFAYILFFGSYGFAKFYIERIRKLPIEILMKLLFFNVTIFIVYLIYRIFFPNTIIIKLPIGIVILMLQFVFLICDYALTLFIGYMNNHYLNKHNLH